MKSVTNSKRLPFHVYRNGHEDGLRLSSSIVTGEVNAARPGEAVSACRTPDGHSTRTTSAPARQPSPTPHAPPGAGRPGAEVDQPVVVVVQKLGGRRCRGRGRRFRRAEAAAPVARGAHP